MNRQFASCKAACPQLAGDRRAIRHQFAGIAFVTYHLRAALGDWKIEEGPGEKWTLSMETPWGWTPFGRFDSVNEAVAAVANRTTGNDWWNRQDHGNAKYDRSRWRKK